MLRQCRRCIVNILKWLKIWLVPFGTLHLDQSVSPHASTMLDHSVASSFLDVATVCKAEEKAPEFLQQF